MSKESKEEKKLSFDEMMEMLKDPALLHAAAAKHGLKIGAPEAPKLPEKKKREMPRIEIPEDTADMPALVKAMNQALNGIFSYVKEEAEEGKSEVKSELLKSKEEEARSKVQKFAKSKPDFEKLIPFIEPYFNSGKSIEEAYELGKRASGIKDEEPEKKPVKKESKETPPRMSKSSESEDAPVIPAKKASMRDSIKANLEKILSEKDLGDSDPLDEKDNIDNE